ncbi:Serine/threonine-protein kinase TEL1 [Sphaceloma murrayae]|uniref:Serine/threonine-protein kinase Tel1 n=1 Tax=Sphaceloma murrayae TaxID=2082308 RepID=A0A2K1QW20_9PEZI|nr:Serine/threonine-protein kinase TEL1 [Sphaceloma murrayae]
MSQISLQAAFDRIGANLQRDRASGYEDLRRILRQSHEDPSYILQARLYHGQDIFEALVGHVEAERSAYLKSFGSKSTSATSNTSSRLTAASAIFRLTIETCVRDIRWKQVRQMLSHLKDSFAGDQPDQICEPLALDNAKSLNEILAYRPHLEHVPVKEWKALCEFALFYIGELSRHAGAHDGANDRRSNANSSASTTMRSSHQSVSSSQPSTLNTGLIKHLLAEFARIARHLTSSSAAPIASHASLLLGPLVRSLQNDGTPGSTDVELLTAINNVLIRSDTEAISLIRDMTPALLTMADSLWARMPPRLLALKEELLKTLILIQPFLRAVMGTMARSPDIRSQIDHLADQLFNDYASGAIKDLISWDEVRLEPRIALDDLRLPLVSLITTKDDGLRSWTSLLLIVHLLEASEVDNKGPVSDPETNHSPQRKRQRRASRCSRLIRFSRGPGLTNSIAGLQLISIFTQLVTLCEEELSELMDFLKPALSDESVEVSSWACFALTCCTIQAVAISIRFSSFWHEIWTSSVRALNTIQSCRTACYMLYMLHRFQLVKDDDVNLLLETFRKTLDIHGPATCDDSCVLLICGILDFAQSMRPGAFGDVAAATLKWLLRTWNPGSPDNETGRALPVSLQLHDILDLLSTCLQTAEVLVQPWEVVQCPLANIWKHRHAVSPQLIYALQIEEHATKHITPFKRKRKRTIKDTQSTQGSLEDELTKVVARHLSRLLEAWSDCTARRTSSWLIGVTQTRLASFKAEQDSLMSMLSRHLANRDCHTSKIDACDSIWLATVFIRQDDGAHKVTLLDSQWYGQIYNFSSRSGSSEDSQNIFDDDDISMGNGSDFETAPRRSGKLAIRQASQTSTSTLAADASKGACARLYAKLMSGLAAGGVEVMEPFIDELESMTADEKVAGSAIIERLHDLGAPLTEKATFAIMDCLFEPLLMKSYTQRHSEDAMALTLKFWSDSFDRWILTKDKDLNDLVLDMYDNLLVISLPGKTLGARPQRILSDVLIKIWHIREDYGQSLDNPPPSARTGLFDLLSQSQLSTKWHIAHQIPVIFSFFTPSNHDVLFEDLEPKLPNDLDWEESITMRIAILAQLGVKWKSLLRKVIYYIVEAAGQAPACSGHAANAVKQIESVHGFPDTHSVFRLFCSQLIYTWQSHRSITDIPHEIFGYDSLKSLCEDNMAELVAQCCLFQKTEDLTKIRSILGTDEVDLFKRTFITTATYAIAHDVSHEKEVATQESSLRKVIGDKELVLLVKQNLPEMIGKLILSTHVDASLERALEKRSHMEHASKALATMKSFAHDVRQPAPALQPSFRVRHLLDALDRLARRAGLKIANLFASASFVAIARAVLGGISPQLGPLHTRAILHKLRLLCSLGDGALAARYPAEMIIRNLRPLINDFHCADDAVGILHYVFDRGKSTMSAGLSSLLCACFSIINTIRINDSATLHDPSPSSQSQITRSNVQKLQSWIIDYARQLSDLVPDKYRSRYLTLVKACSETRYPTEFRIDSPATTYLLGILDIARSSGPIFDEADRTMLIRDLLNNCSGAPIGDDALQQPIDATRYAKQIWCSIRPQDLSDEAARWIGRALGHVYGQQGPLDLKELSAQVSDGDGLGRSRDYDKAVQDSRKRVTARLVQLLQQSPTNALAVEVALRCIIDAFCAIDEAEALNSLVPSYVLEGLDLPIVAGSKVPRKSGQESTIPTETLAKFDDVSEWAGAVARATINYAPSEPLLVPLLPVINAVPDFAEAILGPICHLGLCSVAPDVDKARAWLSDAAKAMLQSHVSASPVKATLSVLVYLMSQPMKEEATRIDRLDWIDIDYMAAAWAAVNAGLYKHALFFVEIAPSQAVATRTSRRISSQNTAGYAEVPHELLLAIFDNVEDPDSFYAVDRAPSLSSVLQRVDREDDKIKSLFLHSACLDAAKRTGLAGDDEHAASALAALSGMNLDSLTRSLVSHSTSGDSSNVATAIDTARRLYEWDIQIPERSNSARVALFAVLQKLQNTSTASALQADLTQPMAQVLRLLPTAQPSQFNTDLMLSALAVMADIESLVDCTNVKSATDFQRTLLAENGQWDIGQHQEFLDLTSHRESIFGILRRNPALRQDLHINVKEALIMEAQAVLHYSKMARELGHKKGSLTAATYLTSLARQCEGEGLHIDGAASRELALVLWNQDETDSSVQMLQAIVGGDESTQAIPIGRAGLLSQLGHQVAEARLEKPDDIIVNYLRPALEALNTTTTNEEKASVYFEFASFCDRQLQNPDNVAEFSQVEKLREQKMAEYGDYAKMIKEAKTKEQKAQLQRDQRKVKMWYEIDNTEYGRLVRSRADFVVQSLGYYLKAMAVSDKYDTSVVRFFALWLDHDASASANEAVKGSLKGVPSWKFVTLLNQIMSRLLDNGSPFQELLASLVIRICAEHPYHSIYQLFASSNSAVSSADEQAQMRKSASTRIAETLKSDKNIGQLFRKVWEANSLYHGLAGAKAADSRTGKLSIRQIREAYQMDKRVSQLEIPPATIHLELRPRADYSKVPTITRFRDEVTIASGISAPKVLTARATDGKQYKQLFKGGNDDLRQDAIMEQVFSSVSSMLRNHTATRRRNLHIRTYIVLPLSSTSGIIEFVPNSIPLHDVVAPAHAKYHPNDMKMSRAREVIRNAQESSKIQRLSAFRSVTAKYSPVLRHFFFERFETPQLWFEKRLAYSRSTAAISILGHVLGLGDRHCHNILLDELSGEVIHIDLGVAFEAGRVLPVPEVVPFRLTRDIVDGMGISGVEGVFRRCCEFVLEALRGEKAGIMTLLNVLRYDPLYSWTVSPLRAKRMQEETGQEGKMGRAEGASEAERALAVVEKKLSPGLSAKAAVNELIQVAADERNLAVLFAGWAAYS